MDGIQRADDELKRHELDMAEATSGDVRLAIARLTDVDLVSLLVTARFLAKTRLKGSVLEPRDLLQEAFARTLTGERQWNVTVPFRQHLSRCMESIAGHDAAHRRRFPKTSVEDGATTLASGDRDSLSRMVVAEERDQVLALFKDDEVARNVLALKEIGLEAAEIQRELGMDVTTYQSVTKRIRRRVVRHLANGR